MNRPQIAAAPRRHSVWTPATVTAAAALLVALGGTALILTGARPAGGPPAPVVQPWRQDSIYITAARTRVDYAEATDGELLVAGRAVCEQARAGWALDEVVAAAADRLDLDRPDAAFVVGVAVRAQCREHSGLIGAE